jgi:putative transposase
MSKSPRVVSTGLPHHVTQRGVAGQSIFISDSIRRTYLEMLRASARHNRLRILAWCLMTNHVHLVAAPESAPSLARTMQYVHSRFAQYWNVLYSRQGHLWQNRYYSCPVRDHEAWHVVRYVEQNPVRAGMVEHAEHYLWSSARVHLGGADKWDLLDLDWWHRYWTVEDWRRALAETPRPQEVGDIREATWRGRPLGSPDFTRQLEAQLGRRIARKVGRPAAAGAA